MAESYILSLLAFVCEHTSKHCRAMVTPPLRKRGANRRKAFASPMRQPLILPLRQLPGQTQGSAPTTAVFKYFRQASPTPNWRQYIIRWTSMRRATLMAFVKIIVKHRLDVQRAVPCRLLHSRAWPGKRWPFTLQKATSCRAKDGLLKGERPHLATRRTAAALYV